MSRRLLIIILLFWGAIFFFNVNSIKAEGICHINQCFVPAPTIVVPENNSIINERKPAIRGLTWKRTLVDIYLDGQYQGSVFLREHENHLQSFFWQPAEDLAVGEHYVYTIAYNSRGYDKNLKGWDQSKESTYIYFTVEEETSTPSLIASSEGVENLSKPVVPPASDREEEISPAQQISPDSLEGKVVEKPVTSGKNILAEEEQKRKQKNLRIFGFIILIIFIIILIVHHYLKRKREYLNSIMEEIQTKKESESGQDNNYPPPPPPINQDSLGI